MQFCTCSTNTTKGLCPATLSVRPLPLPALSTGAQNWAVMEHEFALLRDLPAATLQWAHARNYRTAPSSCFGIRPGIISLCLRARNSAGICSLQPQEKEEQQKRLGEEQSGREGEKEDERLCNYSLTSCKTQAEEPDLVIAVSNPNFFCAFSLLAASPSACNSFQPAHRDRLCPKEPAQLQQPNPTAPTAKALAS